MKKSVAERRTWWPLGLGVVTFAALVLAMIFRDWLWCWL